jgi:hypothetical protein
MAGALAGSHPAHCRAFHWQRHTGTGLAFNLKLGPRADGGAFLRVLWNARFKIRSALHGTHTAGHSKAAHRNLNWISRNLKSADAGSWDRAHFLCAMLTLSSDYPASASGSQR